MVIRFNAAEIAVGHYSEDAPPSLGSGLFSMACRASHSCSPNCAWYSSETGARIGRTLMPVAEGEELTIDYCLENIEIDIMPVHERGKLE
jgi:hypothetical protein